MMRFAMLAAVAALAVVHAPLAAQDVTIALDADAAGPHPSLAWLVHAANAAVKHAGFEAISSPQRPPDDPLDLFEKLSLGDQLPEILEQFQAQFQDVQAAFG